MLQRDVPELVDGTHPAQHAPVMDIGEEAPEVVREPPPQGEVAAGNRAMAPDRPPIPTAGPVSRAGISPAANIHR
ncbi:hypothetical protein ACI2L1_19425 [Streptomyces sp. NPDC019531]|uniref:hypothetical protein n=1 Tax=Streptomyces sp. NPDC019531 TaxID=3365062 RepID=UPI00384EC3A2